MKLIEQRILEYKTNCKLDHRGIQDSICKLSGQEVLEIEDLAQSAHLYSKELLSPLLKREFEQRIDRLSTELSKDELVKVLLSV